MVTLLFRFNEAGLIVSAHAAAGGVMVGKALVMRPWEGRWSDYHRQGCMTVSRTGEAVWLWPQGPVPYFNGTVTSSRYELEPRGRMFAGEQTCRVPVITKDRSSQPRT